MASRRRASDLCLPGNDFWLFDDSSSGSRIFPATVNILEDELAADTAVSRMCSMAFEAVWDRSIPYAGHRMTRTSRIPAQDRRHPSRRRPDRAGKVSGCELARGEYEPVPAKIRW